MSATPTSRGVSHMSESYNCRKGHLIILGLVVEERREKGERSGRQGTLKSCFVHQSNLKENLGFFNAAPPIPDEPMMAIEGS